MKLTLSITNTASNFEWLIKTGFINGPIFRDPRSPYLKLDVTSKHAFYSDAVTDLAPLAKTAIVTSLLLMPCLEAQVHYLYEEGVIDPYHPYREYVQNEAKDST